LTNALEPHETGAPAARSSGVASRRADGIEIAVAAAAVVGARLALGASVTLAAGELVAGVAALLLVQGLVRDVVGLAARRRPVGPARRVVCLCAESSVGVVLLVAAALLTATPVVSSITVGPDALTALAAGTLALGFTLKRWVVRRDPRTLLRLEREADHASVVVG
jgi:hypothetical protein